MALENVERYLLMKQLGLPTRVACVFPSKWKPELNVTPGLNEEDTSYYQHQVGVLRWIVELGRIDICT